MARYNDSTNLDDDWIEDGDQAFVGLNTKLFPWQLQPGIVARSSNLRFTHGVGEPRAGTSMIPGNRFWYRSDNTIKFVGSFVYHTPNGREWLILVPTSITSGITQAIQAYDVQNDFLVTLNLPCLDPDPPEPGENCQNPLVIQTGWDVQFVQGFDKLIMLLTGWTNQPPTSGHNVTNGLFWDGTYNIANNTGIFQVFEKSEDPTRQLIPPSRHGFPISNRVAYITSFIPPAADPPFTEPNIPPNIVWNHLLMSDILDPANLDPILGDIPVGSEEGDYIISVVPYGYDSAVVFMHRSIRMVSGFNAPNPLTGEIDFSQVTQEVLTTYYGICGVRAHLQVGQEIYFIAPKLGLFRLTEVFERRLLSHAVPVSDDIQPIIDSINWGGVDINGIPAATKICMAAQDHYIYIAVPTDNSTVCNAILVFNTATQKWESEDTFNIPNFAIDRLHAVTIDGVRRIVAVQDGPPALVYLLYDGTDDQTLFDVITPRFTHVNTVMHTRAYGLNQASGPTGFRRFHRGGVVLQTINPATRIVAITEGAIEFKTLRESITKSPIKYYIHGQRDFAAGDPLLPKREDYSDIQQQTEGGDAPVPDPSLGLGIMYLTSNDMAGDPVHDLSTLPCWPHKLKEVGGVIGVSLRSQWERMEPHEHANAGDFYWDYMDQGVELANDSGMFLGMFVAAGLSCPNWFFTGGGDSFDVTTDFTTISVLSNGQSLPQPTINVVNAKSFPKAGTIYVTTGAGTQTVTYTGRTDTAFTGCSGGTGAMSTGGDVLFKQRICLPWDTAFQTKFGSFISEFGSRYNSEDQLKYVVIGGAGRTEESLFCTTAADKAALDAIAVGDGYTDFHDAWSTGVKALIDKFAAAFPDKFIILALGSPSQTPEGVTTLADVSLYGSTTYPGQYGCMSCGLQHPSGPPTGSLGATEVTRLTDSTLVGYQFLKPQKGQVDPDTGRLRLDLGLERGVMFGAHFIEVYSGDCNDPGAAPTLIAWGNELSPAIPIPVPPSSTPPVVRIGAPQFAYMDFENLNDGPTYPNYADRLPPIPPVPDPGPIPVPPQPPEELFSVQAQTARERFPIRLVDRWMSYRIENTQGYVKILATSVESTEIKRDARTAA